MLARPVRLPCAACRTCLTPACRAYLPACPPAHHFRLRRNIFDAWLGTDNLGANLGSVAVGLAIILLFRLFKLPLAEFW